LICPSGRQSGIPDAIIEPDDSTRAHAASVRGRDSKITVVGGRPLWLAFRTQFEHRSLSEKCQELP
jgi:hypothetical protein